MSDVVLDSNILLASVLPNERLMQQAQAILQSWIKTETNLVAPRLFRSELVAVVHKAVYQKRITHEQGKDFLAILLEYHVTFFDDDDLLKQAYEIANRFNLPRSYDAQYLALTERIECEFWTADETLFNSINLRFRYIHWLGSINLPTEKP